MGGPQLGRSPAAWSFSLPVLLSWIDASSLSSYRAGAPKPRGGACAWRSVRGSCVVLRFQHPLAAGGVPRRQASSDIFRVEPTLAERGGNATADVVSVGAVDNDGRVGRELLRPLID